MRCDDPSCIFQQSIDQIQQNWLKQGVGPIAVRTVNILILFGMKMNCLGSGRSHSLFLFIRRAYHFCQPHTKFYPTSCCQG
jgi:hypothetical protein